MKDQSLRMELMLIPIYNGLIKVHIYGFREIGSWGQAFAAFNGITVTAKGYNRKKTIIRSLTKLHESLLNQD